MGDNIKSSENTSSFGVKDRCWRRIPLVKAVLRGDWATAKRFFDQDEAALTDTVTLRKETALHLAVGTGKAIHFVENLVELMPVEALVMTSAIGHTALHIAATIGNTRAARILVQKHPPLLYIRDMTGWLPIHFAAINARRDILEYLLSVTKDDPKSMPFSNESGAEIITFVIHSNFYDIALDLVERYPHLATLEATLDGGTALERIARKVRSFPSGSRLNFWQRIIYSYVPVKLEKCFVEDHHNTGDIENPPGDDCALFSGRTVSKKLQAIIWKVLGLSVVPQIKYVQEQKLIHLQALQLVKSLCEKITILDDLCVSYTVARSGVLSAILSGIPEVIEEITDWFPHVIWAVDSEGHNLFQLAIIERQESVFNLIYQMSDHKHLAMAAVDDSDDTLLHLAARLALPKRLNLVPGAALQMQRQLQWFKEVEKLVNPCFKDWKNKNRETPAVIFTRAHKELVAEGEKWMKDTANSCTIAAALIATVVFAAAVTVPGGNRGDNGLPLFSKKEAFIVFGISVAISLFTSTTSLLLFLSILTSRYAEEDFLYILPKRLIFGLVTLFLSITSMILAFSSTLYLVFGQNKVWILIPVAALACLPITSFVSLQFPLLVDLISSTYGHGIFYKQSDRPFH